MIVDYFISQNEQTYYPEATCGVASLMMLLKYYGLADDISYQGLADDLKLTVSPVEKGYSKRDPAIGVYPEDVYKYLHGRGLLFRVSFYREEWKQCLTDGPIMVLMRSEDSLFSYDGHWIVLINCDDQKITYLDPWYTSESDDYLRSIGVSEFYTSYTGVACQIINR